MKRKKVLITIIASLLFVCLVLSVSYAFYIIGPSTRKDLPVTVNIPTCAGVGLVNDSKIQLLNDNSAPISDSKALSSDTYRYSFVVTNSCSSISQMTIALVPSASTTMSGETIKYAIYESTGTKPNSGTYLSTNTKSLNSSIINDVDYMTNDNVTIGYEILNTTLNAGTSKTYYVYVWVDENEGGLGNNVTMNKTFTGHLVVSDFVSIGETYIANATPMNSVMEPTVGATSSQEENTTYSIVEEAGGTRYQGEDPDNYICFDDSCTDDTLYRTIGTFTEMVDTDNDNVADTQKEVIKVIKNTPIGNYAWNAPTLSMNSSSVKLVNNNYDLAAAEPTTSNWSVSTLKNYLNNIWSKPIDKIATVRWHLKGNNEVVSASSMLSVERNGSNVSDYPTYVDSKVGLMYPSDYAYGSLAVDCSRNTNLSNNSSSCNDSNWLNNNSNEWLITPVTNGTSAYHISQDGNVNVSDGTADNTYSVRPVFYIEANNAYYIDGEGSKNSPFKMVHMIKTYKVSFDPNNGFVNPTSINVVNDSSYGTLPVPERSGYHFDGWFTSLNGGTEVTSNTIVDLSDNQTLYAHWTREYKIYLDANNGICNTPYITVLNGDNYSALPIPTKSGYFFDGWYTEKSGGTKIQSNTVVNLSNDQTLYAHFLKQYNVVFNPNGGNIDDNSKVVTNTKSYGDMPTPFRNNYNFDGWYTDTSGGTRIYPETIVNLSADQTLYAHWSNTYCFVAGTKVLTKDGLKNIEDIKLGEYVLTLDTNTNKRVYQKVIRTINSSTNELYKFKINNEEVIATPRHEFYIVDKGWIRAFDIKVGDEVVAKTGNIKITHISHLINLDTTPTYNLTVEGLHSYLITENEILVHNAASPT